MFEMKELSKLTLIELAELMQAAQSGQVTLKPEERASLLDEISVRVQQRKRVIAKTLGAGISREFRTNS